MGGENRNMVAKWWGDEIIVTSRRPLTGRLNLSVGAGERLQLELDRQSAETLALRLRDFLGKAGGGETGGRPPDEGLRPEDLNASNDE